MNTQLDRLAPGFASKLNLLGDLALLWMAVLLAAAFEGQEVETNWPQLGWFATGLCAVWTVTATALRHYDPWAIERSSVDDAALVMVLVMAVTTVMAVVNLLLPDGALAPHVGPFLLFFLPAALGLRLFLFRTVANREGPLDDVLILGVGAMGRFTGEDLHKRGLRRVIGFLRFQEEATPPSARARVLGDVSELESILRTVPVSEVYLAGNTLRHSAEMQAAIRTCEKFGVPFALPAYAFRLDRARPVAGKAVADGYLHYLSVDNKPHQMALKRMFDIVVSATAIWLLLPLFAVVAAAIKLTSRGPLLFKQVRVGLHGKQFHMLKFRSMVVNAEELRKKLEAQNEQAGPVFKMKNDPRVTAVGRFIRKYSIDELPQLINVLRGDMSLVGPRPPIPSEVAKYEAWQRRRLSVRPGLTCIWQVSGRNQISFEQWMYLDMQYIDHWSFSNDLNLLLKTVPVVLTGRGAS